MPLTNTAAQNAKPREKAYKLPGVRIWDMKKRADHLCQLRRAVTGAAGRCDPAVELAPRA